MDKKKIRVLMKHWFLAKKYTVEAKTFDKHYSDLLQENQPLRSGLLDLNEVNWASKTMRAVDAAEAEAFTNENIKKVHKIFFYDRKVKLIVIAETLKISKERVDHIVHQDLEMRKLCAKWMPRVQSECRVCSQLIKSNNVLMIRRAMFSDIQPY
jgi:hypothetical protein